MIRIVMLILVALPSLGFLTTVSRTILGTELQSEMEEVEERLACSSQRRVQRVRSSRDSSLMSAALNPRRSLAIQRRPAIEGHRIANNFLAPMRC